MLDIRIIRENPKKIQEICDLRGVSVDISVLLAVDSRKMKLQKEVEALRAESNEIAGSMKHATPEDREDLKLKGSLLKKELKIADELLDALNAQLKDLMKSVPNVYDEDTPLGSDEKDNIELEVFGEKPEYNFPPLDHIEIGKRLGMDFDSATRVSGSGFPLLKGDMALLENAVMRFVQDKAIKSGFIPNNVPLLAKRDILEGLGFNPRRDDDGTEIFSTVQDDLCLAGTAEISLVGQYSGLTLDTSELPIKVVAMTPCFRREGSYGRRDAGLYRNKMFQKVELVVLTTEEKSESTLEEIRKFETEVFKELGIYFRVIRICAGDLGAPAYKKYDLEGWMMGRGGDGESAGWGELTSCSNCTDYQSRRLNIRHKQTGSKPTFVHTLNGTGITTRALITILEQYQNEDGSVNIPEALKPYFVGKTKLG
tara:strand:+ start:351 stop:1628 length:1278 start_codon:yes stop_codon:yes gene_type:complete